MNFSDFRQLLGADPGSRDPEFLRARESAPEFAAAAAESDRLEAQLRHALDLPVPDDLVDELKQIARRTPPASPLRYFALAASLVLAISAAVIVWRVDSGPPGIESYVAEHYKHDGPLVLERGQGHIADDVEAVLTSFGLSMKPTAAGKVGYIMLCPTPDGVGIHFMVHTDSGPVTVFVMPKTPVDDGKQFAFDGMQVQLVTLVQGSAAIIGRAGQDLGGMYGFVQQSILPSALGS